MQRESVFYWRHLRNPRNCTASPHVNFQFFGSIYNVCYILLGEVNSLNENFVWLCCCPYPKSQPGNSDESHLTWNLFFNVGPIKWTFFSCSLVLLFSTTLKSLIAPRKDCVDKSKVRHLYISFHLNSFTKELTTKS